MNPSKQSIAARLHWGAKWGVRFGLTFAAYAAVIFILRGSAPSDGHTPSFAAVATIYLGGGFVAGLIVGALLPLTRWAAGAAAVGVMAALPLAIFVRLTKEGFGNWTSDDAVTTLIFAVLIGVPIGIVYRKIFATDPEKRE